MMAGAEQEKEILSTPITTRNDRTTLHTTPMERHSFNISSMNSNQSDTRYERRRTIQENSIVSFVILVHQKLISTFARRILVFLSMQIISVQHWVQKHEQAIVNSHRIILPHHQHNDRHYFERTIVIIINMIVQLRSIQVLDNLIRSTMLLLDKVPLELSRHHSIIGCKLCPVHPIIEGNYPLHRSVKTMMIMNHVRFYYLSEEELWAN